MTEPTQEPRYSGLLQFMFPDGTVQYDGLIGAPEDFPLTEAEINDVALQFEANPIQIPAD